MDPDHDWQPGVHTGVELGREDIEVKAVLGALVVTGQQVQLGRTTWRREEANRVRIRSKSLILTK